MSERASAPGWRERLAAFVRREPAGRDELLRYLRAAQRRGLLDADALSIVEGALAVADIPVRDIMVPRARMDVIDVREPLARLIPQVIATAHSRLPAVDGSRDDVIGILLAKDLLRYCVGEEEFDVREMLRPAVFVPESKRVNVLLREFRARRNHMAIVVDEYGGVAGLVTIEDVLEQIVGDIEDEYDFDEEADAIVAEAGGRYRVKAQVPIARLNEVLGADLPTDAHDTLAGLVIAQLGRLPRRGETFTLDGLRVQVLRADARRLQTLTVEKTVRP